MKLRSVKLENFRSYKKLNIKIGKFKFVILTGKNGSGKTNLLEAISFLSPGRGIKNCTLNQLINNNSNLSKSTIFCNIDDGKEKNDIGIEFSNENSNSSIYKKKIHLNGKKIKKQSNLAELISVIWLTPEMDIFFRSNSMIRRKFIDRCIFNLNPIYLDFLKVYEKNLKERNKILRDLSEKDFFYEEGKNKEKDLWLEKVEERLVNEGTKILLERIKFLENFNSITNSFENFPKIKVSFEGKIEEVLKNKEIELFKEQYIKKLHISRKIDSIKKSISYGPNKSDIKVIFLKKNIFAEDCSTGEQKIILISLIVRFCKLMNNQNYSPILLLDEVFAHLDDKIKVSLFKELKDLKNQVWMSGADLNLFSPIIKDKEIINLKIEDLVKE